MENEKETVDKELYKFFINLKPNASEKELIEGIERIKRYFDIIYELSDEDHINLETDFR